MILDQKGCPELEQVWDNCIVYLEFGPRHDLGLYEAIYVLGICIVFWLLRKKKLHYSSFAMLFCFLYAPARFCLDFLRNSDLPNSDIRWAGLTPAQYGSIFLFVCGCVLFMRLKKKGQYEYQEKKTQKTTSTENKKTPESVRTTQKESGDSGLVENETRNPEEDT